MNKFSKEIWAVVDFDGNVLWSRGGSSTNEKLMVYGSELSAQRALKNHWTRQIINPNKVKVVKIYEV